MKKTIAICSSMQFAAEIKEVARTLEEYGWKVYMPDLSEKSTEYLHLPAEEKQAAKRSFITNHFEKIKQSEAILVLNYEKKGVEGYVGSNTLMEIGVAFSLGKTIYLLYSPGEQSCQEEVLALASVVLNGSLELLK